MDRLESMLAVQRELNEAIIAKRGLEGIGKSEWLQKQTLAMLSEMAELLDEVNFKWWKNPHPLHEEQIREEITDLLHFLVSMCIEAGISAEDLYQTYVGKNRENVRRQDGLSAKPGYAVHPDGAEALTKPE